MPSGAQSIASARVRLITPPLDAQYAAARLVPTMPSSDAVRMIEPPPARCNAGMPNFASRNVPPRFTSMVVRQTSSVVSGAEAACITPALAYSTLTDPNALSAATISSRTSSGSVTSQGTKTASPPAPWISSTTSLPSASRRDAATTFAPSAANRMAPARPSPDVAPVITATLPVSRPVPAWLVTAASLTP